MATFTPEHAYKKHKLILYSVKVLHEELNRFLDIAKDLKPLSGRRITSIIGNSRNTTYVLYISEEEADFIKLSLSSKTIIGKSNTGTIDELYG